MAVPRYPKIRVCLQSPSPLAHISAVRLALRQAGIDRGEIHRFSHQALALDDAERQLELCRAWVAVESPAAC
ncbi:MAG: hypothetical protein KDD11_18840 [Acidobacteria bacterium]|nr:hypothetical protein [Acidobacteriota bacterium]